MNKPAKTVYRHPLYTWYSIYTYDHKEFFVELNQNVCYGYSSFAAALEALNHQVE